MYMYETKNTRVSVFSALNLLLFQSTLLLFFVMLPIYWEQIHQMNSICFICCCCFQFYLYIEYFSNLIIFVYYVFRFLKSTVSLLLSVKSWCLLSGVEAWAKRTWRNSMLLILVSITYHLKNKLILHLKFYGTVFYHERYIFFIFVATMGQKKFQHKEKFIAS